MMARRRCLLWSCLAIGAVIDAYAFQQHTPCRRPHFVAHRLSLSSALPPIAHLPRRRGGEARAQEAEEAEAEAEEEETEEELDHADLCEGDVVEYLLLGGERTPPPSDEWSRPPPAGDRGVGVVLRDRTIQPLCVWAQDGDEARRSVGRKAVVESVERRSLSDGTVVRRGGDEC